MASARMYRELVGVSIPRSPLTVGSTSYSYFLFDSGFTLSSNFPLETEEYAVPPYSTAGLTIDKTFLYRTSFDKRMRVEGFVEGNVVVSLEVNDADTSYVRLTSTTVTLYSIAIDGTSTVILPEMNIFPDASYAAYYNLNGRGAGTVHRQTLGVYFSSPIDVFLEPNTRIVMQIRTYGYKSSSTSTTLRHYIHYDKTASDVSLSMPFVGV